MGIIIYLTPVDKPYRLTTEPQYLDLIFIFIIRKEKKVFNLCILQLLRAFPRLSMSTVR